MDTLTHGWTVRTGDQRGDGEGLLKQQVIENNYTTSMHVQDLFHEDAQVKYTLSLLTSFYFLYFWRSDSVLMNMSIS